MSFELVQAEKSLFAVCQTIYSDADTELWYDWQRRLQDTQWTDDCFFLLKDGKRIGGAILTGQSLLYPFLVPSYCDRAEFWQTLLRLRDIQHINGVLAQDVALLPMYGYRIKSTRQVMCRPVEPCDTVLPEGFSLRAILPDQDMAAMGASLQQAYAGGIDFETFGEPTLQEAVEDAQHVLGIYAACNFSHAVVQESTGEIAGVCLAGIGSGYVHQYAEIAELCVLPQHRGKGIARAMINRVLSDACGVSPFVKLCVTVGNPAEYLYRQMGFQPGPRFANLERSGQ